MMSSEQYLVYIDLHKLILNLKTYHGCYLLLHNFLCLMQITLHYALRKTEILQIQLNLHKLVKRKLFAGTDLFYLHVFAGRSEQDDLVAMGTNWNSLNSHRGGRSFTNGGSTMQLLQGGGPSRKVGGRNSLTGLNGSYRNHCNKDSKYRSVS